ncbi:MAG: CHAT domain-containing protein [Synechococcales bacterium]|nr:CHAT domain-containing protein [Synechococcales bacterium]
MKLLRHCLILLLSSTLCLTLGNPIARSSPPTAQLQQAQQHYQAGDLPAAIQLLEQIQQSTNPTDRVLALTNLALIQSQLGNWQAANRAIATSLTSLEQLKGQAQHSQLLAQTLLLQGRLQLAQQQPEQALKTWQRSAQLYQQLQDESGVLRSQIRQASAWQAMGFFRRSAEILESLEPTLMAQPDSIAKVEGLRQLGQSLAIAGRQRSTNQRLAAETVLKNAVEIAEKLNHPEAIATSQLTLANFYHNRAIDQLRRGAVTIVGNEQPNPTQQASQLYTQLAQRPGSLGLKAQLNHLSLLSEVNPQSAIAQWQPIQQAIAALPESYPKLEAQLNFSHSILTAGNAGAGLAASQLNAAQTLANQLGDRRSQAYVQLLLGQLAQQIGQSKIALSATHQGILQAKIVNAPEVLYRLQYQRGQILEKTGDRPGAIVSYEAAVNSLSSIRSDANAVLSETLFSFQKDISPVHRDLVRLLLENEGQKPSEATLRKAIELIDTLQVTELNNFLGADCLQASKVNLEAIQATQQTAIVYPIILSDRLAVITSLPGKKRSLTFHQSPVSQATLKATVQELRTNLADRIDLEAYKQPADQVYNWMIRPLEPHLARSQTTTLVFVLDGFLRNVPMAALRDGNQFLIEKYSVAVTPGLQLSDPRSLETRSMAALAFGLTTGGKIQLPNGSLREFSQLPAIKTELANIQSVLPNTQSFLDRTFTEQQFRNSLQLNPSPIVHLATHGEFSSDRDLTYLLISDPQGKPTTLGIEDLTTAINRDRSKQSPLELLILSACNTAEGDDRAALGLAGMALRSGARSTIASLWAADDQATSILMQQLYQKLATQQLTRSQSLQQAQINMLKHSEYSHPYYWSSFILVGNWL